jgi:hypothetical protein
LEIRRSNYQRAIIAARNFHDLHEADEVRIAVALQNLRDTDTDTDTGYVAVAGVPETLEDLAAPRS